MNEINTSESDESFLAFYRLAFEMLGFKIVTVNFDPDHFSIQLIANSSNTKKFYLSLESLIFLSLELFSRVFTRNISNILISNFYCSNLNPGNTKSDMFRVEMDCLTTCPDIFSFEANCYDKNELLVAKGGSTLVKGLPMHAVLREGNYS